MANLNNDLGPMGVNGCCKSPETRDGLVVRERWLVTRSRSIRVGDRRGLDDQETGTPFCSCFIVSNRFVSDQTLFCAVVLIHGWHDNPVADLEGTKLSR
jgi:hypothetical protein